MFTTVKNLIHMRQNLPRMRGHAMTIPEDLEEFAIGGLFWVIINLNWFCMVSHCMISRMLRRSSCVTDASANYPLCHAKVGIGGPKSSCRKCRGVNMFFLFFFSLLLDWRRFRNHVLALAAPLPMVVACCWCCCATTAAFMVTSRRTVGKMTAMLLPILRHGNLQSDKRWDWQSRMYTNRSCT